MAKKRPGVILYEEFTECLDQLDPVPFKALVQGWYRYSFNGIIPDFQEEPQLVPLWPLFAGAVDRDDAAYKKKQMDATLHGLYSTYKNKCLREGTQPSDYHEWLLLNGKNPETLEDIDPHSVPPGGIN